MKGKTKKLTKSERELAIRNQIITVFLTVPDEEMYGEVLKVILECTESEYGVFGYIDENGALIEPSMTTAVWWERCNVHKKNIIFPRETWGNSSWPRAIREKKTNYTNEPSTLVPEGHVPILRHVSMPIVFKGESIGLIQVANKKTDYNPTDITLLETLGGLIAPLLNVRLERDIQEKQRKHAEEALRKSQSLLSQAEKIGKVGGWEIDIETQQLTWSAMVYDIHEMDNTCQPTVDQGINFYTPASRLIIELAVQKAIEQGEPFDVELEIITARGNLRSVHAIGKADQERRKVIGFFQDISERKQAEKALIESEEQYRWLYEASYDAIMDTSPDGSVFSANPAACQMFGWTEEEIKQLGRAGIADATDPRLAIALEARARTGWFCSELTLIRKGGIRFSADVTSTQFTDKDGHLRTSLFIRDNTERKQGEEALRLSEDKFRNMVINLSEGFYSATFEGRLLNHNIEFNRILGYDPDDDLVGFKMPDFWQYPEERTAYLEQLKSSGVIKSYPIAAKKKNGENIHIEANSRLINDEKGQPIRIEGTFLDVTARKLAEKELKKYHEHLEELVMERTAELTVANEQLQVTNKELESFAYSVSHDLRTPLRSIDGFSLALLEDCAGKLDEQGKDYLRRVRAATQRMATLIDDILTLSRITRKEMIIEKVNLSNIARSIVSELQKTSPQSNVETIITEGLTAKGDPVLLEAVMQNLLDNAWKFTSKKEAARVEFGVTNEASRTVYFVRDNGVGFDMKYADKLFGTFQRLHSIDDFPGTGIGLATVQRIIHRHRGQVWGEGTVGEGAVFYFTLPDDRGKESTILIETPVA